MTLPPAKGRCPLETRLRDEVGDFAKFSICQSQSRSDFGCLKATKPLPLRIPDWGKGFLQCRPSAARGP